MKTCDPNPAQRQLVHEFTDWDIVKRRCEQFPAIGRAFPVNCLRSYEEKPPFYCHYMAWRLGTWCTESLFSRFNELLDRAQKLPNWSAEESVLKSADFAEFWSLVWQLQMAEYLSRIGSNVRWAKSGPDLSVDINFERWFIECYVYRKSFGLLLFLEEVLRQVDPAIRVTYDWCLRFRLPNNEDRSQFLHSVLSQFLDKQKIEDAKAHARHEYPVVLYKHKGSSLVIYVEGEDINAYEPGLIPNRAGDPERYLENAMREAINAKQNSNALGDHRPNLLAVNYLCSADVQLALSIRNGHLTLPVLQLGPNIDALAIAAVGIDAQLEKSALRRAAPAVSSSPALNFMTVW